MKKEELARSEIVKAAGFGPETDFSLLVEQGSDRLFYRLSEDGKRAVLMISQPDDPDFERYVAVGRFLYRHGLGVPEFLETDPSTKTLVMEDLGDETLYVFTRQGGGDAFTARYRGVIELLAALQTETHASLGDCPAAAERALDSPHLLWETRYFRENFLEGECGLPPGETAELEDEFNRLAKAVANHPMRFLHRDFQSMNILIKDGRPRIVDFQGARRGSIFYDLASLLKDSYVPIPKDLRAELFAHFLKELAARSGPPLKRKESEFAFLLAGLQRNMQALGAFAFLSRVKKKEGFRRFMPQGLRHLREGIEELRSWGAPPGPLPLLAGICDRVAD